MLEAIEVIIRFILRWLIIYILVAGIGGSIILLVALGIDICCGQNLMGNR